ncbi:MAG: 2-amino-4-hydroxy-6-hydroxymethyldihydropteridine diphosphokinase [Nitrospinae bacterium]|nr:2-amino-4-hydroxy-6-hydroxymethyldihydropteridine diphosphokinase [Nitrospinota bacterium]
MNAGKVNKVLLGLGSNINPLENIQKCLKLLYDEFTVIAESSFYSSPPVGYIDQNNFINGCALIESNLSPNDLKFNKLRVIEKVLGRERTGNKNSSRTIDIDILLFGDLIIKEEGITVPDPDLTERNYLLIPALEISGEMIHPIYKKKLKCFSLDRKGLELITIRNHKDRVK